MIVGIGTDIVQISMIEHLLAVTGGAFERRAFTAREQNEAGLAKSRAEYLAGRFAVKEAAFKAIAPHTQAKHFDFRVVETLHEADGAPVIRICEELQKKLDEANIEKLFVSISTDGDYAVATVVAESCPTR